MVSKPQTKLVFFFFFWVESNRIAQKMHALLVATNHFTSPSTHTVNPKTQNIMVVCVRFREKKSVDVFVLGIM